MHNGSARLPFLQETWPRFVDTNRRCKSPKYSHSRILRSVAVTNKSSRVMARFLLGDIFSRASVAFITRPRWLMPLLALFELEILLLLFRNSLVILVFECFNVPSYNFSKRSLLKSLLCLTTDPKLSNDIYSGDTNRIFFVTTEEYLQFRIQSERSIKRLQQNIHSYLRKDCQLSRTEPEPAERERLQNHW